MRTVFYHKRAKEPTHTQRDAHRRDAQKDMSKAAVVLLCRLGQDCYNRYTEETRLTRIRILKKRQGESIMSEPVFKKIEITGCSAKSIEDAVQNALKRASKTVRNMRWFEIVETRGTVDDDKAGQWQVTMKVGFKLEED
jgi:flavin-binding protein dodecin